MNVRSWLNGEDPGALALSRGLHYGDGVFRTLLVEAGQPLDAQGQIGRLLEDARALQLQPPEADMLLAEIARRARGEARAVLKILLLRRSTGRGYAALSDECECLLQLSPAPRYADSCWTEGIDAFRCSLRLAAQTVLAGIKHLNRLEQVLASRDWPPQMQEGILCDAQGRPVCGTRSNLFWVSEGTLQTPDLSQCGVAGRMRQRVLAHASDLGLRSAVVTANWGDLERAEEAFVTNSLIGLWPLRSLGQRRWNAPGPCIQRLQSALQHPRLS